MRTLHNVILASAALSLMFAGAQVSAQEASAAASASAQAAAPASAPAPAAAPATAPAAASAPSQQAAPAAAPQAPAKPAEKLSPIAQLKKDLGATETAKGTVVDLPADTVFDFNQSGVRIEAAPLLQKVADLMRLMRKPVVLTGHTDNKGNAEYDKKLSEYRAKALKGAMVQRGIRASTIQTAGAGQEKPKAANANPDGSDNPKGRESNRRIEVLIAKR
jgi:outer membrane protein OmpA-like peptidoglycan-associated protein